MLSLIAILCLSIGFMMMIDLTRPFDIEPFWKGLVGVLIAIAIYLFVSYRVVIGILTETTEEV